VRSLPFSTDEFFAAIRECYNRRAQDSAFERLTFCLLGVATPSDLIRDTRLTPFNIGKRIELTDFTGAEAAPLAAGLLPALNHEEREGHEKPEADRQGSRTGNDAAEGAALLQRVLYWTAGHPYLTQRLCHAAATETAATPKSKRPEGTRNPKSELDRHCAALFLSAQARERDDNLLFLRERLLTAEAARAAALIGAAYHCLDEQDVRVVYDKHTVQKAVDLFRRVAPSLVFTHAPKDYMMDHEMTSLLARAASFGYAAPNVSAHPRRPESVIPHLYYCDPVEGIDPFGHEVEPTTWVDVSRQMEKKTAMLACHASQRQWLRAHHGMDEYLESMERHAAKRGKKLGVEFAEAFDQLALSLQGQCHAAGEASSLSTEPLAALLPGPLHIPAHLLHQSFDVPATTHPDRHLERIEGELGMQRGSHAPADDAVAEGIQHKGDIAEAAPGRHVRQINHPSTVPLSRGY